MGVRLAGDLNAEFPFGTYHMCHFNGAPVAEAPHAGEALITAPGPLLCDVLDLLEQERQAGATPRLGLGFHPFGGAESGGVGEALLGEGSQEAFAV
ncbi:MAG: hypothetical protein OXR73_13275 [Myxococcales bacterium]|nr:hypothetical protein [Myxococcales bacterium]